MTPAELKALVAEKVGVAVDVVEGVLNTYGVSLQHLDGARSLRLTRLRVVGVKPGPLDPGPFDHTFHFESGVTVITGGNLRGKTSILEICKLMLRGAADDLQGDVRSWLRLVCLDLEVNGQATGLRLRLEDGQITHGSVISGTAEQLLISDDSPAHGVAVRGEADDDESWAELTSTWMMNLLSLEELMVYTSVPTKDVGQVAPHGWPAYFGAVYPPSGADRLLLGGTSASGLVIRLLEVFLNLPNAALYTRVDAAAKRLTAERLAESRRAAGTAAGLDARRVAAQATFDRALATLTELQSRQPADGSLRDAAEAAEAAARETAAAARVREALSERLRQARENRIVDQRRAQALKESAIAGALFHGLDPAACPRCETTIGAARRTAELDEHLCAICSTSIEIDDTGQAAEEQKVAEAALSASRDAEKALQGGLADATTALKAARAKLDTAEKKLASTQVSRHADALLQAELAVATASGAVDALGPADVAPTAPSQAELVLAALADALKEQKVAGWERLSAELDQEVADLGVRFGIDELEKVVIKRNGNMDVYKGGTGPKPFGKQSGGERMRLRFAVVLGLLRVGQRHGVASHPGLLLLDSLQAEEMQQVDAVELLDALIEVASTESVIQIIATTQNPKLTEAVSGAASTIAATTPDGCLF